MDIEKMTLEQIEAHLEERKKVKPRATPESVVETLGYLTKTGGGYRSLVLLLHDKLDWTPPKHDYEMELVEGMPCLGGFIGDVYLVAVYDKRNVYSPSYKQIPFNRNLVGKAVE